MSRLLSSLARDEVLYAVTSTRHILINTEGRVHPTTFSHPGRDTRHTQGSENKVTGAIKLHSFISTQSLLLHHLMIAS